ncbi:MAG: helix-turn-helix domain-containing protein [Acidobacteria bacterium]|nr:helix-turn-helix domain-containing protein [Acidobacteriota bacterium]
MAKDFSLRIKKLRKSLGLTQHALAQKLGVLPWAVSSWEQERWEPSGQHYAQLARLAPPEDARFFLDKLGIDREMIRSKWPELAEEKPGPIQPPEIRIYTMEDWKQGTADRLRFQIQIPVLRDAAAAGTPREINERDIDSFIAVPEKFVPQGPTAYTGIYIRGDSMEPILGDRFIVVVDHMHRDPMRLRGRMVAALVQEGVLVKWLARDSRRDRLVLRSQNPVYEDIVLESPETNPIIGNVVFWWGTQGKEGPGAR